MIENEIQKKLNKIIDFCKNNSESYFVENLPSFMFWDGQEAEAILNLIEKLKQENEEYKTYIKRLDELNSKDFIFKHELNNYISKDKIRELDINCFPRHRTGFLKGVRTMGTNECAYFAQKVLELLEEE